MCRKSPTQRKHARPIEFVSCEEGLRPILVGAFVLESVDTPGAVVIAAQKRHFLIVADPGQPSSVSGKEDLRPILEQIRIVRRFAPHCFSQTFKVYPHHKLPYSLASLWLRPAFMTTCSRLPAIC